ncbi:hypothetical protein L1987_60536 [Smallanthus sonchifolius]|uniref:Uncharacterized protein n=1 Tax=Smallanthus sonchifolius TaxID=185202 RepID=A0ACB9D8J7_9ASTR|nr:hypothetical protein L1987_60536 [Smallanthus sonchifolius]
MSSWGRRQGSQGQWDGNTNENQVAYSPRQGSKGLGDGNSNDNQVGHSPHLIQPSTSPESYHTSPLSSFQSQNADEMGNQIYDFEGTSSSQFGNQFYDDGFQFNPNQQLVYTPTPSIFPFTYGVNTYMIPHIPQIPTTRPPLHYSPLSGVQNMFDLNMSGNVNEDGHAFDDVEDVEADEAVQVTDCIARRKPTRLTRHPRCGTE